MIKRHIEKTKARPYAEKSSVAFAMALAITGVIAAVWFMTIFTDPSGYFEMEESEEQKLANSGSLFDVFKEGVR